MIEHLSGKVLARLPNMLVIDVNGVGYGVEMPLSSLCDAPLVGQDIAVWIETYVREDALKLYGFNTFEDRQAFSMLRSVSGIGPKIALAVLSTLDARALRQTVLLNKVEVMESVPGIGRRTAEKMMLELKPKMEKLSFASPSLNDKSQSINASVRVGAKAISAFDELESLDQQNQSDILDRHFFDLRSALENLGYKEREITPVISQVRSEFKSSNTADFSVILKTALRTLRASI